MGIILGLLSTSMLTPPHVMRFSKIYNSHGIAKVFCPSGSIITGIDCVFVDHSLYAVAGRIDNSYSEHEIHISRLDINNGPGGWEVISFSFDFDCCDLVAGVFED